MKKIIKNAIVRLPKQKGSKNLCTTVEELQELSIEIQKFLCDLPNKNMEHLTEEFADCVSCIHYLEHILKYKPDKITDSYTRVLSALHNEDYIISTMIDDTYNGNQNGMFLAMHILSNTSKALCKVLRGKEGKKFLLPYLIDTEIALYCIQQFYHISTEHVKHYFDVKQARQNRRNKSGNTL